MAKSKKHAMPWQKPEAEQAPAELSRVVEVDGELRLKLPQLTRAMSADEITVDAEARTLDLSFSSEYPVERWFGTEVLSHERGAADFSRLNDGAPLLFNHNPDEVIGVVESARMADSRGVASVRFADTPRAREVMGMVNDKILRNVSFGYRINEMDVEDAKSDTPTYRATSWTPYEISLVSIPADPTIGVGRSDTGEQFDVVLRRAASSAAAAASLKQESEMTESVSAAANAVNVEAVRAAAAEAERGRIAAINALGAKFSKADLARQLIDSGKSLEESRTAFLEVIGAKQAPVDQGTGVVDMTAREQKDYSVVRAINAALSGDWRSAGFEREVSDALATKMGRATQGFFMPLNLDVRAAYAVGATSTGGANVATNLLASSFIEVLRNKALVMQLGPTMLTGLVGNVAIPRQISQTSTYWVTEASALTEAEATFDQVTLSPKQIGARSQYSRLMLQQSTPDIEGIIRNDLAKVMALGIDLAAINGSGTAGQPKGILNQSGIGSVAMGTNGAAFTNATTASTSGIDQLIQLEKAIDVANALNGNLYYLTNAKVVAALKQLKTQYADYLWSSDRLDTTAGTAGSINGYPVARSNQVPSSLTKGTGTNLSALILGDFSQLLIGMWGGLEILPNPYGSGYTAGSVDIRAMQTMDLNVRHVESFAAITDIIA